MKTIVAAIDSSKHSAKVLQRAAGEAVNHDAELILVHAVSPHELSNEELEYAEKRCGEKFRKLVGGGVLSEFQSSDEANPPSMKKFIRARDLFFKFHGEDLLKQAGEDARKQGVKSVRTVLKEGAAAKAVLEAARDENADLIVIGRSGQGRIAEFFLGSTARKILNNADRSVLTVE
ncbi:MAG: hypothetical protein C0605_03210 [Hyphomicrobiales bacterium]|nr:MAG: hypothetical protein C0605_03210 [Hyphomicrobiales bacterium]